MVEIRKRNPVRRVFAVTAVAAVGVLLLFHQREPRYGDRALSEWLEIEQAATVPEERTTTA
jgi:hypothetical protein